MFALGHTASQADLLGARCAILAGHKALNSGMYAKLKGFKLVSIKEPPVFTEWADAEKRRLVSGFR
jgi:hypothetical protein